MKKMSNTFLHALFIWLTCFQMSFSQSNWIWQNPLPSGNDLYKVKFANENTGYAVGANFTITKSTDAGKTWQLINSNIDSLPSGIYAEGSLHSIFFINSETGFVGGNNLFKTTNGGDSWVYINSNLATIHSILFTNDSTGYIAGENLAKTTNGGANWFLLNTGVTNTVSYKSVYFPSVDTGYICAVGFPLISSILKTTNGGINWTTKYSTSGYVSSPDIHLVDNNTGYVSSFVSTLMRTTNGGNNWVNISTIGNYKSIYFASLNTGYATGNSSLYKTTNSGNNWSQTTLQYPHDVDFFNDSTGFVAGTYGKIWKSINSGANWELIPANRLLDNLNSIHFVSQNKGFVAGENGNLLMTTNGGNLWNKEKLKFNNYDFKYIKFFGEDIGYLTGDVVLKTNDGGLSWDSIAFFNNEYKTQFINENTGFIYSGSFIHKTSDGGSNWIPLTIPQISLRTSFNFVNSNVGYFSHSYFIAMFVYNTRIYKTVNSGESWEFIGNLATTQYMLNITFGNEQLGFLNGVGGIWQTSNGGVNWASPIEDYGSLFAYFFNTDIIYVPATLDIQGKYYKTTNGGINWTNQFSIPNARINSTFYTDHNTGYIVGNNGLILKTTNGGGLLVGVNNIQENIPEEFSLNQNNPNPFNPVTKITFSLPQNADVELIVYDLLGKEVRTLVNEKLSPGKYTFDFDGSDLPSGVYYYKLETDSFIETRKMILLK